MNAQSWFGIAIACCLAAFARAQPRTIDTAKSVMTVHVYKSGVFSAFGHDHEIAAPISGGTADPAGRRVELHARATALRVSDAKVSDKDREEIQKTMLGAEVLDAERYPEITFRSTSVDAAGARSWKVTGDLTLHGQTHPVTVEVREADGHYVGTARFKQTEFGIKPVKIAGGAVRVKDELQLDFNIQLAH
jgi:polyisoprenoid-binding protein YceI